MAQLTEIKIPFDLCKAGGSSLNLFEFVYNWMLAGYKQDREGTNVVLRAVNPKLQPEFEDMVDIVTNGGSFVGVKCGLRILKTKFTTNVPLAVPNSTHLDDQGNTVRKTWKEWADLSGNESRVKSDNIDGIMKASWQGKLFTSEELHTIHGCAGVTVIGFEEFKVNWQSPEYAPQV